MVWVFIIQMIPEEKEDMSIWDKKGHRLMSMAWHGMAYWYEYNRTDR